MNDDTINLNPDPLAEIEAALRSSGLWCDVYGVTSVQHYYMAKNPKLDTAVSLCGQSIKSFSDLVVTKPVHKCLVCDLFATSREEVKDKKAELKELLNIEKKKAAKCKQTSFL